MQNQDSLTNAFIATRNDHHNESLADLLLNASSVNKIIEHRGELVQKTDPIYKEGEGVRAHFFAPNKLLFGSRINTFWVNVLVLLLFTFILFLTLWFDLLRRLVDKLGSLSVKVKISKEE